MKYIPRMRNNNIKLRVATQKNVEKKEKTKYRILLGKLLQQSYFYYFSILS